MFAASVVGIPVQLTTEERIATTANEKARLLDLGNGSSLPDPSTLKDWPLIFLSDLTVFLMDDHQPGKDMALHEHVLSEYKEGMAYRLYEFTGTPYQLHQSSVSIKSTVLIP